VGVAEYLLDVDVVFGKFIKLKFPTFSVEGIETKYFKALILYLIEFYSSNEFAYLSIFLEISVCGFYPIWPFDNLDAWICYFFSFLQWGVSDIFA